MQLFFQIIVNGIITSSFYAIIAVGLCLTFGVMRMANFAHGELFMIGAYIVWLVFAISKWPFFISIIVSMLGVGLLGALMELTLFKPLRGKMLSGYMISLGLVFIFQVLVGRIWGIGQAKFVPTMLPGSLAIGNVYVPYQRLIIIPAALILLGGLYYFLKKTKLGRGVRACALDAEAASLYGVNINLIAPVTMGIGCAMAGVAGGLMAPIYPVEPYMGSRVIWTCFVVIIVGGPGNIKGTMYAAIIFGLLSSIITTLIDSTTATIIASLVMLGFLTFKPEGLLSNA